MNLSFCTTASAEPLSATALRRWLRNRWALLFSHPEDFASNAFESDRWLVHVEEALRHCNVAAVALATRDDDCQRSWVIDAGGCSADLELARTGQSQDRCVAIVDPSLRVHRTFTYSALDRAPSPIDLAGIASTLRATHVIVKQRSRLRLIAAASALALGALAAPTLMRMMAGCNAKAM